MDTPVEAVGDASGGRTHLWGLQLDKTMGERQRTWVHLKRVTPFTAEDDLTINAWKDRLHAIGRPWVRWEPLFAICLFGAAATLPACLTQHFRLSSHFGLAILVL